MKNFESMDRDTKRAAIRECAENQQIVIDCRNTTDRPDATVQAIVDRFGYDRAVVAVAELVNTVGDWDERVSDRNRAWAASIDTAATRDELRSIYIFSPSAIHPAHIDQIADNMRKYEPKQAEEEQAEEETEEHSDTINGKSVSEVLARLDDLQQTSRSAWARGVASYAFELLEELNDGMIAGWRDEPVNARILESALLNGANDWSEYSWGGCSLIYDEDIARRLCTPSELKKTRNGQKNPNSREQWLDTQARALFQASRLVSSLIF